MSSLIIPFVLPLPKILPTIDGNVDYRTLRDQLVQMDRPLVLGGLKARFIQADLERWLHTHPQASPEAQQRRQFQSTQALRCNIARLLLQEDYRGFAARLADSPLLQFFCKLSEVDRVEVPSKSDLERYAVWWTEEEARELSVQMLQIGAQEPQKLELPES